MTFFLGISITLNVIFSIILFLVYRFGIKGFKNKIEDYVLENFLDMDNLDISKVDLKKGFDIFDNK